MFDGITLGNFALVLGLMMGILSATALMAVVTMFTESTRFYASVNLWNPLIVVLLTNLVVILGSLRQVREVGKRTLVAE